MLEIGYNVRQVFVRVIVGIWGINDLNVANMAPKSE